ncbi:MAG: hypothetical protein IJ809_02880 [Clostridia bacterium]|nr:hypothetical protein [Clostridia bacterium]
MKISNVIKFILALAIVFSVSSIIPFELYRNANYHYDEFNQVEGSDIKGPMAYISKIVTNEDYKNSSKDLKDNFSSLNKEYQNVIELNRVKYNNVIICLFIISGVSIITIGILIFKLTKAKAIGLGIISGSVLTVLTYIFIFSVMLHNATLW